MPRQIRNPPVANEAPNSAALTSYDKEHATVYVRLLDAEADGADWMEASLTVLRIDPVREPARARRACESHLSRAKWMTENGYLQLPQVSPRIFTSKNAAPSPRQPRP